jgi:hypothetical protein
MTEPLFKPSNRWILPEFGKILMYGESIFEACPTSSEFSSLHNLGPEKAKSYLEHLRACCVCEYNSKTKKYQATQIFSEILNNKLDETDVAALIYFNYIHYMAPTRWLVLDLFNSLYYSGANEVDKDYIFKRYSEIGDSNPKTIKSLRESIQSLTGLNSRSILQLSAFRSLRMYEEQGSNILLSSFTPSIKVLALTISWAWKRNFGKDIFSLGTMQIIRSPEFPFRSFRMSEADSILAIDELFRQGVLSLVRSVDLDQVYYNYDLREKDMYVLKG